MACCGIYESFGSLREDIRNSYILDKPASNRRKAPIMVEFVDPDVTSVELARAMEAGMNIFKFKTVIATKSERIHMLSKIDKATERCAARQGALSPVATCATLKTWVKKIGIFQEGFSEVTKDSEITLTCDLAAMAKCSSNLIYVDYGTLTKDVTIGMEVTIGQRSAVLYCTRKINDKSIKCKVHYGGKIHSLETVFFRNHKNSMPLLSSVDINVLKFCSKYQVDMLMMYYTQDLEMVQEVKRLLSKRAFRPLIFSAICDQNGLNNLEDILKASDGIVFCREFLSYELDSSQVHKLARLQKWVAGKCLQAGKPIFLSGVYECVLAVGDVSDADKSDITNALMDGVGGFLLRDCTHINKLLIAIKSIDEICCQVEPITINKNVFWRMMKEPKLPVNAAEAAVISCVVMAIQTGSPIIIITSVTGNTARTLMWLRPACIVIALCNRPQTARRLYAYRNIVTLFYDGPTNERWELVEKNRIQYAAQFAMARHWVNYKDNYVTLQRSCDGHLFCDMVRVWTIKFKEQVLVECHYDSDKESKIEEREESMKKINERKEKMKRIKKKKKDDKEKKKSGTTIESDVINEGEKDDDVDSDEH